MVFFVKCSVCKKPFVSSKLKTVKNTKNNEEDVQCVFCRVAKPPIFLTEISKA
jgi:hypothetical protein